MPDFWKNMSYNSMNDGLKDYDDIFFLITKEDIKVLFNNQLQCEEARKGLIKFIEELNN